MILIGDTHFDMRRSNQTMQEAFHGNFAKFLKDIFQYCDDHKVKTIVQMGDLFDVRASVGLWAMDWFIKEFRNEIVKRRIHCYVIVGNHDIRAKESIVINSPMIMLSKFKDNFTVVDRPLDIMIDDMECLLVPWICKENEEEIYSSIDASDAKYLFGHFELNGFEMYKGQPARSHHDHKRLAKFDKVFSGHFHHRSIKDNIIYVGTPWEMTWQCFNDQKGVHELKKDKLTFIENPYVMYNKIIYSDDMTIEKEMISGKILKLIIQNRPDKKKLNSILDKIYSFVPLELKIEETFTEELASEVQITNMKNTRDVLHDFIEESDIELEKDQLKSIFDSLYQEAIMQDDH